MPPIKSLEDRIRDKAAREDMQKLIAPAIAGVMRLIDEYNMGIVAFVYEGKRIYVRSVLAPIADAISAARRPVIEARAVSEFLSDFDRLKSRLGELGGDDE